MTMRNRFVSRLFVVAALLASGLTLAASAAGVVEDRGTLRATVGGGQVLTFSSPVRRIAIADEKLAAVHLVSEREVLINGQSPGVTTLFIWLDDDRRVRYVLRVGPNVDFVAQALREIDPRISVDPSPDGSSVVLRGDVADARTARVAKQQAELLLRGGNNSGAVTLVLNLLRFPGITASAEDRLAAAVETVDPRIHVRRIQVGDEPDADKDSFVLEGNVRTLQDLQRAVALAERQLGGTGVKLKFADEDRIAFDRQRNFNGMGGRSGSGGVDSLSGVAPIATGLASKVARGMVLTSESGRVISFLEVDELAQLMVSIRVLEIDRGKARKMGVNFRLDTEHVSIGNYTGPQTPFGLPPAGGNRAGAGYGYGSGSGLLAGALGSSANVIASFVDSATSILTAIDFLDSKSLVRSVAEPNILTLSGEQATVLVGGEVPIPTATSNQVATFQGVFFQDFGVRLDIRPTVDANGIVTLEVAPSIVRPDSGLGVGAVPGFQVQTVQTVARVAAGESLVLGGLLSFEEGLQQRGLPGLQKVPLFRWKNKTHSEQELMFVITPRIVGVSSDAARETALPALEWPEDRGEWIEAMRPLEYEVDGIPESFMPEDEPATLTPAPLPAPIYGEPTPAPVYGQPIPAPAPAPVQQRFVAEERSGVILKLSGNTVVVRNDFNEIRKYTGIPAGATVYFDGQPTMFRDLREGMHFTVIQFENVPPAVTITMSEVEAMPSAPPPNGE
jgi:pilus assembly protein CpaC